VARARWLQWSSRRVLRVFGAQVSVRGDAPHSGLLVCNHLSYLDVLVLASLVPVVFVAKADVARWPLLGRLTRLAGTVFVRRERRSDVARVNREMQVALNAGSLVVVFPEGTSSGGDTVLHFRSSLFDAAIHSGVPATAGCIRYRMPEGNPAEEVCYWRDMTLFSHLLNLLGRPAIEAFVAFTPVDAGDCSRKELARRAHTATLALHSKLANPTERLS
jgi:1-acyl-sn-glycerol-3-phosphate acyltransferase